MSVAPDENNLPPGTAAHGWLAIGGERVEGGWRYPERNAQGERIGVMTRCDSPPEGGQRYSAAKGGKRGLIFPAGGLPAYAGTSAHDPILVAEGASDAVCLVSFGFTAVGVPMAGQAAGELAALVQRRHVVLLGDNDDAGRRSVETLGAALIDVCASVRFAFPPDRHKDVRSWVADGGAGDTDIARLIEEAQPYAPEGSRPAERPSAPAFSPFPIDALPRSAANLVRTGADALQVDMAMLAPLALASMAAAIGNARVAELSASWREPAVLWSVVVAPSGTGKSPALELVTRPAERRDAEALREHREATKQHAASMILHEKALRTWERGSAKGNLADTPPTAPEPPVCERFITSDVTVEALAAMLAASPRGLLLACDELASWLGGFTRYTGNTGRPSSEAARWLPMHRAGPLKVDRRTAPPLRVERASLNIAGLIQPGVLAAALTGTDYDSGLVARLLLSMPPTPTRRWRPGGLSPMVERAFSAMVEKLYSLDMPEDEHGTPVPRSVPLDEHAGRHWAEYYNELNHDMAGQDERTRAMLSKLEGGAARLALVVHLGRVASAENVPGDVIDGESMRRGIILAKWFRREAERVYMRLAEGDEDREARHLLDLIRRKGGSISGRELVQSSRAFHSVADAESALSRLVDAGHGSWVTPPQRGRGGPKARRFVLPGESGKGVYRNPAGVAQNGVSVDVDSVDATSISTEGGAAC
ncbi:MAG: hypothetical protein HBSAPP03_25870 [Phycisphaerae bacterium]|nr:MAG: hypothetical protein HBSAPP03_25870 [Phycisphaerae bacterium]